MSTTKEMRGSTGSGDEDALRAAVTARAPEGRAEQVLEFARMYTRRLDAAGAEPDPEALGAEIVSAYSHADSRAGAPSAVRAFTPDAARDGYGPGASVVQTNTADLPFLVDSVSAEIRARGVGISRVVHPIVGIERDDAGHIARVHHPREGGRESAMHFQLDRRLSPEEVAGLEDGVRKVLAEIARVVADFGGLRGSIDRMVEYARAAASRYDADDVEDAEAFLRWLTDEHFVFLGYREYEIVDGVWKVVEGSGLGLLKDTAKSRYAEGKPLAEMPETLRRRATEGELVVISRTNAESPIRRRERMDYIGVRKVDEAGEIVGEARLVGLFATRAYAEPASMIPLVGRKLERILAAEDLIPGSHDYKAAMRLFDSFPKNEVFGATTEDLRQEIVALLGLTGDQVRLLGRRGADGRTATLIAALPRRRFDAAVRRALRELVAERFGVEKVEAHEVLGEEDRVQYHLTVHSAAADLPEVDFGALEAELRELSRTWDDGVRETLVARHGAERGAVLAARWLDRFPRAYRAATPAEIAAGDVDGLEAMHEAATDFAVGLQDEDGRTRVALYKQGAKVELSQATRLLEDLGLRVIEELPTRLESDPAQPETWLQAFGVLGPGDAPLELAVCADRVAATLDAAWRKQIESDSLHRLIVLTDLNHRQVEVLRAYRRYRQRLGSRYTEGYQNDAIAENAAVCAKQMRLFELRFDPSHPRDEAAEQALREEILADIDQIVLLDHDRIMRNQLGVIDATVRTNVYRRDRQAIAFKLRSAEVPTMPPPAPLFEIYVYAPDMEGIHIRGGMIARGGLRWSERADYRTEVFGLMRAQMTKNAVIVPAGAKGGFLLRHAPADVPSLKAAVQAAYEKFIGTLLDLPDNLVDDKVVHPPQTRILDGDDAYFVVAADKGTATFSDIANGIAERRGFWLGDAFASGGSAGYDHKALGITARGAWESVKRHFRQLGHDTQTQPFTVVGIGDMSGDVFGNGMLLSDQIRLVAAYDHRHVFIDPDPDPAAGYAERKRLFELPGSSWDDYDRAKISAGGGVFPRTAKSIPLSEQARAALGIEDTELAPTDLIRAVLRAPVDLLWNGGIGTVVKSSLETDADAMDRSSDAIRVDADQLRVRVIGEGGNLGLTQRARIEAAQHGTLVNADFIDNSAGVDCSDHEVNLKILLGMDATLDRASRNALLEEVTDPVCEHVLYDSYQQAQILAAELRVAPARLYAYEDLITQLETSGMLTREIERLPDGEQLSERRRAGAGLVLPELAVLVAYAKRDIADALLESPLLDDPCFEADLRGYFPAKVVERMGEHVPNHPLRRELAATLVSNEVVNALGPTFVSRLQTERGAAIDAIVRAYRIAVIAMRSRERWDAIEALDGTIDPDLYWTLRRGVDELVETVARWELANAEPGPIEEVAAAGREGCDALRAVLPQLRSEEWRADAEATAAELIARGAPEDLARSHAMLPALVHAPDIIVAAQHTGRSVEDVAATFFALGDHLRLEWLEDQVDALSVSGRMQRWAASALADDVLAVRRALAEAALTENEGAEPAAAIEAFFTSRAERLERLRGFMRALSAEDTDLAGLTLAVRQLRALA